MRQLIFNYDNNNIEFEIIENQENIEHIEIIENQENKNQLKFKF
jgi:hypothetical protein